MPVFHHTSRCPMPPQSHLSAPLPAVRAPCSGTVAELHSFVDAQVGVLGCLCLLGVTLCLALMLPGLPCFGFNPAGCYGHPHLPRLATPKFPICYQTAGGGWPRAGSGGASPSSSSHRLRARLELAAWLASLQPQRIRCRKRPRPRPQLRVWPR